MPFHWQRHLQVPQNYDANGAPVEPPGEMVRASGDALCELCGRTYYRHPVTYEYVDWDGHPYLHVGCDGTLLKL
jgi:hypothetical protein